MARRLLPAAVLVGAATYGPLARAAEYSGRVMAGALNVGEKIAEPMDGDSSNDQRAVLGRFYLDVTGIGAYRNEVTVDVRDHYDALGKVDQERVTLTADNDPDVRQLAVKYPFEVGTVSWSIGRFPLPQAGVRANDGAELGVRIGPRMRAGVFGGLIPEHGEGKTFELDPTKRGRQAGAYGVLQDRSRDWEKHTYAALAVVAEETLEPIPLSERDQDSAEGVPVEQVVESAHSFSNIVYQPSSRTRVSSIAYVSFTPSAYVRNAWLALDQQLAQRLRMSAAYTRLDLSEYKAQRDIREGLEPSAYDQGRLGATQRFGRGIAVGLDGLYGKRSLDGLTKMEVSATALTARLGSDRIGGSVRGGFRKGFERKGPFVRVGAAFYMARLEAALGQEIAKETESDGGALNVSITDASLAAFLGGGLFGALTAEYAKDERATVTSLLATVGYRFNSKNLTPTRTRAPEIDDVRSLR
jgi:hypothetical protein